MPPRGVSAWLRGHAPDLRRNLVGHQPVEPALGAGARHFVLGERSQIDDADAAAQAPALVADVLEIVGAAKAPVVLRLDARRREPVGALPAVALAEYRTHALELVVHRAGLERPRILALLVRKVNREDVAIGLLVLLHHVALAGVRPEAPRIDGEHVDARLALDDPFRELPARAAGGGDAEAVPFVQPEIAHAPGRADHRAAVGRVGDRAR